MVRRVSPHTLHHRIGVAASLHPKVEKKTEEETVSSWRFAGATIQNPQLPIFRSPALTCRRPRITLDNYAGHSAPA
jgi:hypothetical protein